MPFRNELLLEFRASYDRMEAARTKSADGATQDDAALLRHAERNFYACAEVLARRVPVLLSDEALPVPDAWREKVAQRGV